jgi:MFS family permease
MFLFLNKSKASNQKHFSSRNYHSHDNASFNQLPLSKHDREFVWSKSLVIDHLAVYTSIFLSSLAYGIAVVLIALKLEANVENEILISFSTVAQITAGVFFSRFLPSLGKKIGMTNSIFFASITVSIATICLYKFISYPLWIIFIFIMGTSLFITSVTRNTIMIDIAPTKFRALSISIGSVTVAVGTALGPIIINILGTGENLITFIYSAVIYIISGVIIFRVKKIDSIIRQQKKIAIYRYIIHSPKIMLSGFTFSYVMCSCSAYSIIYGLKIGLSDSQSSLLLTYLLLGNTAFIPLSYLCNKFNLRFLMILFSLISLTSIIHISKIENYQNLHFYFFALFVCLSGIKLPTLVLINEKYKSTQRLAVNSAFTQIALIGAVFGLVVTGITIKAFGYGGLWYSTAGILVLHLTFCFLNYARKIILGELKLKDFSIFKKTLEPQELNEN